jgi:hypothetical protein
MWLPKKDGLLSLSLPHHAVGRSTLLGWEQKIKTKKNPFYFIFVDPT